MDKTQALANGTTSKHPRQVLLYLKRKYGIKPKDIDAYAINFDPKLLLPSIRRGFVVSTFEDLITKGVGLGLFQGGLISKGLGALRAGLLYLRGDYLDLAHRFVRFVIRSIGEDAPEDIRIIPVIHHLAHAVSAYYFSGFNNATVLTVDGYGEFEATVIWRVRDGEFEKVASIPTVYGSLGLLYEGVSIKVGYETLEGPGKVMGLAPYGKASKYYERLKSFIRFDDMDYPFRFDVPGRWRVKGSSDADYRLPYKFIANALYSDAHVPWSPHGDLHPDAVDLAWVVQAVTEETMLNLARWAREHTGEDRLALAGGVALNAKANMVIHYAKIFNDIFIFPAANDAGGPIGAAAWVYEHVLGGKMKRQRLRTVYLGPGYGDDEVRRVVERGGWDAKYIGDDVNEVVDLVVKGHVVAWYQGRAELGPRALSNRSIIADPRRSPLQQGIHVILGTQPKGISQLQNPSSNGTTKAQGIRHRERKPIIKYYAYEIIETAPMGALTPSPPLRGEGFLEVTRLVLLKSLMGLSLINPLLLMARAATNPSKGSLSLPYQPPRPQWGHCQPTPQYPSASHC